MTLVNLFSYYVTFFVYYVDNNKTGVGIDKDDVTIVNNERKKTKPNIKEGSTLGAYAECGNELGTKSQSKITMF